MNKTKHRFEFILGFLTGIVTPLFGLAMMYQFYPELGRIDMLENASLRVIITRVSTFGLILNAGLFFLSIQLERDRVAKGLLYSTLIYIFLLILYKFIL
ncbi:MAG: hypothetical protein LPK80_12060 [Bacteroidota bacterium]|nr:hypothetical protein [Bacteroidota bacterium]MDX5426705.1 hypothetical protein [Bacteroidota bacterium]MDX5448546.1 hypothetical protein [Bacteroidota bacterium]MDX5504702.1 hypothetical protein [Bacteroidota bacterium]